MKRRPKRKAPAKAEASGRRRKGPKGDRLNRTRLSERLKLDRKTVSKYLAMPGAPKPDAQMRYSVPQVRAWVERVAGNLPNKSDEYKALTLSIKRMQAEDMELDLKERRGELVEKKTIEPTVAKVMTLLTETLKSVFEVELPGKYDGRSTAERTKLNAEGVDRVLSEFKQGLLAIT